MFNNEMTDLEYNLFLSFKNQYVFMLYVLYFVFKTRLKVETILLDSSSKMFYSLFIH